MTFTFTRLSRADFPLLHRWLNEPHVQEWWGGPVSRAEVDEKYVVHATSATVRGYFVHQNGAPFAYIQAYDVDAAGDGWWPDARAGEVGVDQFIGEPAFMGKGLGSRLLRAFCDTVVFADPAVVRIITDPAPANARAIRAYEKAGFVAQGLVDTPDGKAMLMTRERGPDIS